VDEEIDRLYGLPLEEFVPERDVLAKQLRVDKRREDANAVKALRKPSVAAWAVNQALRSNPDEKRALLEAGDALRSAQEDLVAGRSDAAAVREASEAERQAVGALMTAARGLAREKGFLSQPVLDRVRETLHAAATDDGARAEVELARVSREHRPAAFGGLEAMAAPPTKRPPAKRPRKKAADLKAEERQRRGAEERERKAQARARRQEAQARLKAARAEEREAAKRRREAERALEAAVKAEDKAADRRAAAEEALRP
jgi:hypothetical protein